MLQLVTRVNLHQKFTKLLCLQRLKKLHKNTFFASLNTHLLWHFHCPSYPHTQKFKFFFPSIPSVCNFIVGLGKNFFYAYLFMYHKEIQQACYRMTDDVLEIFWQLPFLSPYLTAIKWNIHVGGVEGSRHSSLCGWMK